MNARQAKYVSATGHLTLGDVRQRVNEMLSVLLQSEEETTEAETWKWLDENLVGTG